MGFEKTAKETLPASARESGETLSERERKKRSRFFPSLSLSLGKGIRLSKKKKTIALPHQSSSSSFSFSLPLPLPLTFLLGDDHHLVPQPRVPLAEPERRVVGAPRDHLVPPRLDRREQAREAGEALGGVLEQGEDAAPVVGTGRVEARRLLLRCEKQEQQYRERERRREAGELHRDAFFPFVFDRVEFFLVSLFFLSLSLTSSLSASLQLHPLSPLVHQFQHTHPRPPSRAPPRNNVRRRVRLPRFSLAPGAEGKCPLSEEGWCAGECVFSALLLQKLEKGLRARGNFLALCLFDWLSKQKRRSQIQLPFWLQPPRARPLLSSNSHPSAPLRPFSIERGTESEQEARYESENSPARSHRFSISFFFFFVVVAGVASRPSRSHPSFSLLSDFPSNLTHPPKHSPPAPPPAAPAPSPSAPASSGPPRTSS